MTHTPTRTQKQTAVFFCNAFLSPRFYISISRLKSNRRLTRFGVPEQHRQVCFGWVQMKPNVRVVVVGGWFSPLGPKQQ